MATGATRIARSTGLGLGVLSLAALLVLSSVGLRWAEWSNEQHAGSAALVLVAAAYVIAWSLAGCAAVLLLYAAARSHPHTALRLRVGAAILALLVPVTAAWAFVTSGLSLGCLGPCS